MNDHNVSTELFRTAQLPKDIFTGCLYWENGQEKTERHNIINGYHWSDLDDKALLSLYSHDGSRYHRDRGIGIRSYSYWPCTIISRNQYKTLVKDEEAAYTVRLFQPHWIEASEWNEEQPPIFLTNYPKSSIKFFTKPYRSDLHHPSAFRHALQIPEDMFPEHWKNKLHTSHGSEQQSKNIYEIGDIVEVNVENKGDWAVGKIIQKRHGYDIYDVTLQDDSTQQDVSSENIRIVTRVLLAASPHPF